MPDLLIRDLDETVKARLGERAKAHGRSLSSEARAILQSALAEPEEIPSVYEAIRKIVEPYGGFDIELPPRDDFGREPPDFR